MGAARLLSLLGVTAVLDVPVLMLNLISGQASHEGGTAIALYAVRFATGAGLQSCLGMMAAVVMAEKAGVRQALSRSWRWTSGHRVQVLLFVIAFFVLKLLVPYLLVTIGLQELITALPGPWQSSATLCAQVFSSLVWSLLGCTLAVSMALIYGDLGPMHRLEP